MLASWRGNDRGVPRYWSQISTILACVPHTRRGALRARRRAPDTARRDEGALMNRRLLMPFSVAVAAVFAVTACGGEDEDEAATNEREDSAEDSETDEADGANGEDTDPENWPALSEDQIVDLLINSGDLSQTPDGHSTHSGLSYFEERLLAEDRYSYAEAFGDSTCAAAMDSINQQLVGEDPDEGFAHEYRLGDGEEGPARLFAWALSFEDTVDHSETWEEIQSECDGEELGNSTDSVEVEALQVDTEAGIDFTGLTTYIHGEDDGDPYEITAHSASADVGNNLLMLSAQDLSEEDFRQAVEIQAEKIAEFQADDPEAE